MKKDIYINFILTFLISVVMFFQNKYFIEYLGIEKLGIMRLFTQLLQYLNIVEMGLGGASAFALYKPLAHKEYDKVSKIISTMANFYNRIALTIVMLGIIIMPILPYIMKIDNFSKIIYFYWILLLINTVSTYFFAKYLILFTANQEFRYVRYIQSGSKILYQFLQIISLIYFQSFCIFILLMITDNITQYFIYKKHFINKYSFIYKTKEKYIGLKKDIKNLFWHKIGGLIVFNTDLVLISKLVSVEMVGIYSSYQIILQTMTMISRIITNAIQPRVGIDIAKKTKGEIYISFKKLNIFYCFLATFFSINFYFLVNSFIKIWLGKEYILSQLTIFLISLNIYIIIFRQILDIYKEGFGFFSDIQSPIIESILNLIFSIILGIKYGIDGILCGTIISNVIVVLVYKPILVYRICFNKSKKEYINLYSQYLMIMFIIFIIFNKIDVFIEKENIINFRGWICFAIEVSLLNFCLINIIFFINKGYRSIIQELLRNLIKIFRKKNN